MNKKIIFGRKIYAQSHYANKIIFKMRFAFLMTFPHNVFMTYNNLKINIFINLKIN